MTDFILRLAQQSRTAYLIVDEYNVHKKDPEEEIERGLKMLGELRKSIDKLADVPAKHKSETKAALTKVVKVAEDFVETVGGLDAKKFGVHVSMVRKALPSIRSLSPEEVMSGTDESVHDFVQASLALKKKLSRDAETAKTLTPLYKAIGEAFSDLSAAQAAYSKDVVRLRGDVLQDARHLEILPPPNRDSSGQVSDRHDMVLVEDFNYQQSEIMKLEYVSTGLAELCKYLSACTKEMEDILKQIKKNLVARVYKSASEEDKELAARVAARSAGVADPELVDRVASRAISALSLGKTFESDKWRVQRYSDFLVVTHLENAGKRGKKCDKISIEVNFRADGLMEAMGMELVEVAKKNGTQAQMDKVVDEMLEDYGNQIRIHRNSLRGVDVLPAGFGPMEIITKKIDLRVEMDSFSVRDMSEAHEREVPDGNGGKKKVMDYPNMPTCIPSSAGKKDLAVFYRWVKDNEAKVKNMSYSDVVSAIKDLNIPYHTYCAMD